jgi:ABC-type hemin transport system ATPase subunit
VAPADARALLNRSVAGSGCDLSGGERQLLCLARVLLRCRSGGTSPMVLDETTSGQGPHNDTLHSALARNAQVCKWRHYDDGGVAARVFAAGVCCCRRAWDE